MISSELRDGMQVDWDVAIPMDDGIVLRADVFRPPGDGRFPVLLTYGPYAKGLAFQQGYPERVEPYGGGTPGRRGRLQQPVPELGSRGPREMGPARLCICVRVDSRGCGRSPGFVDHFSPRETQDFYECIEWAGVQPWSNGRVGLNGVSYYGINQWHVASRQPPHLAAMCIWEGAADWYRDMTHHGGILSTFWANWYDMQVKTVQHGLGERGPRSPATGRAGLRPGHAGRSDARRKSLQRSAMTSWRTRLDDEYHRARSPDWSRVVVPFLSAANWGGQGLHPARQLRGVHARRVPAEMAGGARDRALDAFLHRLRPRACNCASSIIS